MISLRSRVWVSQPSSSPTPSSPATSNSHTSGGSFVQWAGHTSDRADSLAREGENVQVAHALEASLLDVLEEGADRGTSKKCSGWDYNDGWGYNGSGVGWDYYGGESFGASQIDTSVALSPNTSGEELSQAAVEHSYSLSPGDFQPDASQFNAAVNLQLLSEASGFESGAERSDEEQREPDPPVQTLHQRTCVKYDVNFVLEDKDESDYKSFSSGKGEGLGDNDDEPEQNDIDDDDDVLSKGDAKKTALRATQWTAVFSNFKANVTVYAGMNNKKAQPVSELRTQTTTISSKSTDGQAIEEKQRVEGRHGRVESVKQIRQRLKMKRRYKTHDILRALVVLIARMLCPQNSRFTDHWAMMEDGTDPAGNFGCFMARNRCQDILRDLNYVDNAAPRIQDKFWKL
ncbi:hypothetical protein L914_02618 [Phytophthora nicotianae]|uniref:PiggyBac transposable element-derived protein domain-containing protein n=1 Tax=Phytophthora nicotianae TaxID=4792 RepID=W2NYY0_PHYNI|nr:hypothetical protein L914_02618 [Phytophthora nicotianae]